MGLEALQRDVLQGVPTINHNRWFAAVNEYQERYPFVVEGAYSLPVEPGVQSLFEYIMRHHLDWGMAVYEQDWLVYQFLRMNITKTDVHAARNWLMGMGEAARNLGLTIQFCMPLPADFLQSLEMPAVTQIRCSDDYLYHDTSYTQWKIGRTAMLAWAVGLRPFKDNFWSTSSQPGNTYHKREPNPELQAIVSVLSAGPVALSDKIGLTNRTIAMATCRKDGVLLKPDMVCCFFFFSVCWHDGKGT